MSKTIVFNDTHHPFQDKKSCDLLIGFIEREQPDQIVANGDILDCYKISRFDKDPRRRETFQDEIDECYYFLEQVRQAAGSGCEIIYDEGNHEERLQRYLWTKAPELDSLECLTIPGLLWLDELNIAYKESVEVGKFHIYHGSIVRQDSGYTAKAEWLKNGCSGITGHTHRDGKFSKRTRGGQFVWYENFCLCDLDAEYIKGVANWAQGWSIVHDVSGRQYVEQIPVINHRYLYNGKVYK